MHYNCKDHYHFYADTSRDFYSIFGCVAILSSPYLSAAVDFNAVIVSIIWSRICSTMQAKLMCATQQKINRRTAAWYQKI